MTNLIDLSTYRTEPAQLAPARTSASVRDAEMVAAHVMLDADALPMNPQDIVVTADQLIDWASDQVLGLLSTVSYDELVRISNACADRGTRADHHFLNEIICAEFGRRHQEMDPENYPPTDGAA
jgi:hypothetical protein